MTPMQLRMAINAAVCGLNFGLWQSSISAGCWMLLLIGCAYSGIDYFKEQQ